MGVAKKRKLIYIHHNPNSPEVMEDFLVKWYAEALIALECESAQHKIEEAKKTSASA